MSIKAIEHTLSDMWEDFYGWRFKCSCGVTRNVHSVDYSVAMASFAAHVEEAKQAKPLANEPIPGQTTIYDYIEETKS